MEFSKPLLTPIPNLEMKGDLLVEELARLAGIPPSWALDQVYQVLQVQNKNIMECEVDHIRNILLDAVYRMELEMKAKQESDIDYISQLPYGEA